MNKTVYLSEKAHPLLKEYLKQSGMDLVCIKDSVGSPIGTHADLYYCQLSFKGELFAGDPKKLNPDYPGDCIYNAACTGKFFIHNTKISDPELLAMARKKKMKIIEVRQGYAKCSCITVDEKSIITADEGIARKCRSSGSDIDCLLISPGSVLLEGFRYGFAGGASGRVADKIIFHGDLSSHPDHLMISRFITERGLGIKYFPEFPLTDIGSIICC